MSLWKTRFLPASLWLVAVVLMAAKLSLVENRFTRHLMSFGAIALVLAGVWSALTAQQERG